MLRRIKIVFLDPCQRSTLPFSPYPRTLSYPPLSSLPDLTLPYLTLPYLTLPVGGTILENVREVDLYKINPKVKSPSL